nr:hypothetical protein [Cellulosimicrobium sp. MM]
MSSGWRRRSATVRTPSSSSRAADTGPTPHSARTGRSSRNGSSSSAPTTRTPPGFAASEASFATSLDRPSPSETGRPLSSRARSRMPVASASRSVSGPTAAATSANASSMLTGSTRSVTSRSAAMIRAE